MRVLLTMIVLLALPAALTAQQATDVDAVPAEVQLQQSVTTDLADPATAEATQPVEPAVESAATEDDAAAVQDPGSRTWWYIVGAVVVGGLIVALLL